MKALILDPSPALVADRPKPIPAPGEALVRVNLCGICNTDLELMRGYMGFRGVPGHEFVGEVINIGDTVPSPTGNAIPPSTGDAISPSTGDDAPSSAGDDDPLSLIGRRVAGEINAACGKCDSCTRGMPTHCLNRTVLGIQGRDGAMAEYLTLPIKNLHMLPDEVSDEAAVFVEPLAAAYEILEQVYINNIQRVLVMGDGKLGLLCAMVISTTGAKVTLMGRHESKLALVKPYGVKTLLDGGEGVSDAYDFVVEATGTAEGFERAMQLVRPRGVIVLKSTVAEGRPLNLAPIVINEIMVVGSRCGKFPVAIAALANRTIDPTPLIEATYPMDDALKAFEHAAQKGALKVLVRM